MASNPFQLLVFDWDGTLMDSQARIVASFQAAIQETGAQSIKDMGKVMKLAIEKASGQASNDRISKMVKEILTTS